MNDGSGDNPIASIDGEQEVAPNDKKKRAFPEVISSHQEKNQVETKKQKRIDEVEVSGSSLQNMDQADKNSSHGGDDDAPDRFASLSASSTTNVEYDQNRTDVIDLAHKDAENSTSALSSACSSPVQSLSPTHTSEEKEFVNGSAGSITSAASSTSSSSSFICPPAPPTTPISAPYDAANAFYNVATPKPHSSASLSPAGLPELPTNEAMRREPRSHTSTNPSNRPLPEEKTTNGVTRKPLEISHDFATWNVGTRYELMRILGKGSYGEVAQAKDLHVTQPGSIPKYVAIKRISTVFQQDVDALRLFREIHLLRGLRGHDCIIQLIDIVVPGSEEALNDLYLVFEYVDTDLYKLIMSPQYLTTAHIRTFLYQMLKGLKHLHSSSVIHRDLKPANILLNEDCSLKICDFGLARIVDSSQVAKSNDDGSSSDSSNPRNPEKKQQGLTRQLTKHVVTRWYRAPELILIQPYTTAVDIWSVGCIFAELLSMQEGSVPSYEDRVPLFPGGSCFPLSGDSDSKTSERLDQLSVIFGVIGSPSNEDVESIGNANQYIKTLKKSPSKSVESMYPAADAQAIDLLKKMLQFNPSTRCTADEALSHAFLEDVRQVEMEKNADGPLVGPDFLNSDMISIEEIKKRILEEVSWFKEQDAN